MNDPFIQSLVGKTTPTPYNQAVILSQKTINSAFSNMWLLADPTSPIRSIAISTRDGEKLQGELLAPTVIVNVVDFTYMLYFQWNFKSGSMTLYTTDDPNNPTTKTFDLTQWTVAFGTSLTRDTIPPTDPSYAGYKQQMGVPADSQFSLAKLYVKSQETPGYYPQGSSFNGLDWSKETPIIQAHFEQLRYVWMDQMANGGLTHIGVMLQTDQPATVNPNAPTFPPTSIDYAVYPWKDPSNPLPPNNDSDSNALCYLIMTNNATPPVPPQLPYSGTWVDADAPETGRDAILCMNKSQFWAGWLLPLMRVLNLATQIQPTAPILLPYQGDGATVGLNFTPGTCTQHPNYNDDYYNFTPGSDGAAATATTNVKFTAGGPGGIFTLVGNNTVSVVCDSDGDWGSHSTMDFTMQYTLTYVAQRVDDGGVQILQSGATQIDKSTVNTYHSDSVIWTPPWDQYGSGLQSYAATAFQSKLGQYQQAFLEGLAGQNKLFLPGSGSYLCNQVMFNNDGDLLTNLAFNGAAPPGKMTTIPEYLLDAPPRQYPQPYTPTPPQEFPSLLMKPIRVNNGGKKKEGHHHKKHHHHKEW
ncbi:hypothetical protein BGZ63DRAFT_356267 [Mariannaea sp. PMI_226]|nr:hypothetical protein BGZ63DRAFT_356267 [Mariannaea sp. PMI_226]